MYESIIFISTGLLLAGNQNYHSLAHRWEGSHRLLSGTPVHVATLWDHLERFLGHPADQEMIWIVIVNLAISVLTFKPSFFSNLLILFKITVLTAYFFGHIS
jgi:hypothetical protein